jgi:branched-chain amino acid transport system permease protein
MDSSQLFSALVSGAGIGSMYGLTALGYNMTYAVSRTVNFAQGAILMLGAVVTFQLYAQMHWPAWLAIFCALLVCGLWSAAVEILAVRPFVKRGSDSWLMATVALGLILENVVLFTFGKDPRGLSTPLLNIGFEVAGLRVTALQAVIPVVGFGIALAMALLMRKAGLGKAMQAVAQKRDAARLMGIDVEKSIAVAFAIAGVFAGIAGILIAPLYTISAGMGTVFGIKAFAAAILGGIESPGGVMAAGLLLGIAEAVMITLFGSTYAQMLSFGLTIAVLAAMPNGLFGRAAVTKI